MDIIYTRGSCPAGAGARVDHYYTPSCGSTMESAFLISRGHTGISLALRSDTQRSGRGRTAGRIWVDDPGKHLLCTWVFPSEEVSLPLQLIPLAAGTALKGVLHSRGAGGMLKVKWPNDLLYGERKLCGVLCEGKSRSVLIGIGLNVHRQRFPDGMRRPPVCLEEITNTTYDLDQLAREVSRALSTALHERTPSMTEEHLYGIGRTIDFMTGGKRGVIQGRITGIASDGALMLESSHGVEHLYSGEILRISDDDLDS